MGIPGSANPLLLAQQYTGYRVQRSLRFNSSDSAYCSRVPSSSGNRRTFTWSGWIKRGTLTTGYQTIFGAGTGLTTWGGIRINNSPYHDKIQVFEYIGGWVYDLTTTAVFRDPSAWYHLLVAVDTTQATASNRVKIYINGAQLTAFDVATYPAQNTDLFINSTNVHTLGTVPTPNQEYFSGYLAECYLIDGQQLTPSSFTEVSATTGQLVPKQYSGSYGTNGFKLDFSNNASTTTVSQDSSGNNNHWTANNISVAAGAGNDSLVDTPTSYGTDTGAGGEVRGNYATLNPLRIQSTATLTNGNLDLACGSTNFGLALGTIGVSSGKWYWEVTCNSITTTGSNIGIADQSIALTTYPGGTATSYGYNANGSKYTNGSATSYGATYANGNVIGVALDLDAGTLIFYKNGTSQGTAYSSLSGTFFPAISSGGGASTFSINFGQRPFAYTAPSGFKALCDTNLPSPQVAKPSTVFDTKLYTGNGSTQNITGLGFSPDLVWLKSRSGAGTHGLFDAVRGTSKSLYPNLIEAEGTLSGLTGFNSDGFSLGTDWNINATTFAAWCWDAGSSNSTNTQGSITSTVRANASAGFSVVAFNSGSAGYQTIGHGLNAAPTFIICKSRANGSSNWTVYHASATTVSQYLVLNSTAAVGSSSNIWGTSAPTSTVFGFYTSYNQLANENCIAYCWTPVSGYSSFGSYTGNGSADGPFVHCGFLPRYVLTKISSGTTGEWLIWDSARKAYNSQGPFLQAQSSAAEGADSQYLDLLSNGFKLRSSAGAWNLNNATYIYAAFAENPFQYSRAR